MIIPGHATAAGTARYSERFNHSRAKGHFRDAQQLRLSSIGIGTYLGNPDEVTDRSYSDAVVEAVSRGANVIDTAANYRFQRSERSIGDALDTLINEGNFSRDELVVCTKGGYLPFDGRPPTDVRRYVEETFVKPGIANFEDIVGGSHCMTPAYLRNQLAQSLRNMKLATVDVYYIHNPESQLGHVSETEFYDRLRSAFAELENMRTEAGLRFYGVATWDGFRVSEGAHGYHSLERMVQMAERAGGEDHGFRFVQMPFNLAMPEAFTVANQKVDGKPLAMVEAAAGLGVTVIASASILQGRVANGLPATVREALGGLRTDAQTAIQFVRSTPGITTALVGMRDAQHVNENLELTGVEPVSQEQYMELFSAT
jgi:aryl-alcohol dehydrogenase-like predicted oxidoreductase